MNKYENKIKKSKKNFMKNMRRKLKSIKVTPKMKRKEKIRRLLIKVMKVRNSFYSLVQFI